MGYVLCRDANRRERPAIVPPLRFSTNLNHFYPVAERAPSAKIPLDGILLGAAGIRSTEYGYTKICTL